MARQDYEKRDRDDDRWGRSGERYWDREDDQDDIDRESRRGREFQGREHQGREYQGRERGRERYGETRYGGRPGGGYQDTEDRARPQGYGGRGWESSGMGGPRAYGESRSHGESGTYGGSSMYGGGYGAGMMGEQVDWRRQDEYGRSRRRGGFFGRGPKGYQRSDERIREDVNEALFRHEDVDATEIVIEVREGMVTLSGTVDSREARRMAEDAVWDVSGVKNVTNMMRVESEKRGGNGEEWKQGSEESSRRGTQGTQGTQQRTKTNQ